MPPSRRLAAVFLALWLGLVALVARADDALLRIGVLVNRDTAATLRMWAPLADYLDRSVEGYRFQIVPLPFGDLDKAIRAGNVDFAIVNPGQYVELEARHGASRIATVRALGPAGPQVRYGGVILTSAKRGDLRALPDLRGKRVAIVAEDSMGGWLAQWREMREAGLREGDILRMVTNSHETAVFQVLRGDVDAATVRTGILEEMVGAGKVNRNAFRVLNPQPVQGFPLALSTRLYPEWPFVKLLRTPEEAARRVTIALLEMPPDSPAARYAGTAGWTIPLDYQPVHELLRELGMPPYDRIKTFTSGDVFHRYRSYVLTGVAGLAAVLTAVVVMGWVARRLARSRRELLARSEELDRANRELRAEMARRTEAEAELRESQERYRQMFMTNRSVKLLIDPDSGAILDANPAAAAFYGYDLETLKTLRISDINTLPPTEVRAEMEQARSEQRLYFNFPHRLASGEVRDVEVYSGPVTLDGRTLLYSIVHDVTERHRAEEALRRLNESLEQRVKEEVAKNREKDHLLIQQSRLAAMGEMVHNIAHQWRQPLNALMLVLANIRDAYDYKELTREVLDEQMRNAQRLVQKMSTTIDDFRDFFRPRREQTGFRLNRVVEETLQLVEPGYTDQGVELLRALGPDAELRGYPNELSQVLLNLLANAKDAIRARHPDGGGRITVSTGPGADDGMVLAVADNGGGVPEAILPKIFDPYFSTKDKGSGIGLYMSRMIVENMGGTLEARNTAGGAEFLLYLPAALKGNGASAPDDV